ncbi:hypothetical protein ABK040_016139 [Willaertia magna]
MEDCNVFNNYNNFITGLTIKNNNLNNLNNFQNLKTITFFQIKEEIILKENHNLESISIYGGSNLTILNCNKLNMVYTDNLQFLQINQIKYINNLTINNTVKINICINKIKQLFLHNEENIKEIIIKTNEIKKSYFSSNIIKDYSELLFYKNNLQINDVTIYGFSNQLDDLIHLIEKYNLQKISLTSDIYYSKNSNNRFIVRLEINNLQQLNNCKDLITVKKNNILLNAKDCNVHSLMLIKGTYFNLINFKTLKNLCLRQTNVACFNFNNLNNLKELTIEMTESFDIYLNNLTNLKKLQISQCKDVHLELENKRMKLQYIYLNNITKININLILNCPQLYKFHLFYNSKRDDVVNIEFYNTPLLRFPKIKSK